MLSIQLLGYVQITCNGRVIDLPNSRKTRALIAYLILSGAPQRRDRLCEMFWDRAHDSRGSLRWSLSKLRKCLNQESKSPLVADRERIHFDADHAVIDVFEIRAIADADDASLSTMDHAWESAEQLLMSDCELPHQNDFMVWLRRERVQLQRLRARLARRATLISALAAEERMLWADRWLRDSPDDHVAAEAAIGARRDLGLHEQAGEIAKRLGHGASLQRRVSDGSAPSGSSSQKPTFDAAVAADPSVLPRQKVRFVRAKDDVALAWACVGDDSATPLVKAANWLSHLELDWEAPIWSPLFRDLAQDHRVIRYDERGCGLSDWEAPIISFETFVSDIETVVDAAGLDRFPLLGISQGAAVCIEYAVRHPERVSHLILFGGYPVGWRPIASEAEAQEREAIMLLVRNGWGRPDSTYRRLFSQTFMPDATLEELNWFDEFQRRTTSPENAMRFLDAFSRIDVRHRLKDIATPTLVLHSRGDRRIPLATGLELAASVPNAEFVSLESNNHLLIGREAASQAFVSAVRNFIKS